MSTDPTAPPSDDPFGDSTQQGSVSWDAVDDFFARELALEDEIMARVRSSSAETTSPRIDVTPHQGALLKMIAQIAGAGRVLEFGTLAGYSAIWFARAVGPRGRVVTLELEEQNAQVARRNAARADVSERIEVVVGAAADSARRLIEDGADPFDVVFIDADKARSPEYLELALRLTGPGAVIIIDNVVRSGEVVSPASDDQDIRGIREVAAAVGADASLEATVMQTVGSKGWDGFLIARRR